MKQKNLQKESIEKAYNSIRQILEEARNNAYRAVNSAMVRAYWEIGRIIVEEEQHGKERAEYAEHLIESLSKKLTGEYGWGFARSNLFYMKQFYLAFRNIHALR